MYYPDSSYKRNSSRMMKINRNKTIKIVHIINKRGKNNYFLLIFRTNSLNKNLKTYMNYYSVKYYKTFNKTVVVILN